MRNNRIDFYRGIAILMVIYGHLIGYYFGSKSNLMIVDATMGVWIFFIISGYLMYDRVIKSESVFMFWKKRLIRILPLAYLLMIIYQITDFKVYTFLVDFGTIEGLRHFWSLKRELTFYMILPPVYLLMKKFNFPFFMEIYVALSPLFIYLDFHTKINHIDIGYFYNILFMGCLTRKYLNELKFRLKYFRHFLGINFLVVLFGISVLTYGYLDLPVMLGQLTSMVIFSLLFVVTMELKIKTGQNLSVLKNIVSVISKIGRISFSIYIFQQYFTQQDFPLYLDFATNQNFDFIINCLCNLFILFVISLISFWLMEKKLHDFLTRQIQSK